MKPFPGRWVKTIKVGPPPADEAVPASFYRRRHIRPDDWRQEWEVDIQFDLLTHRRKGWAFHFRQTEEGEDSYHLRAIHHPVLTGPTMLEDSLLLAEQARDLHRESLRADRYLERASGRAYLERDVTHWILGVLRTETRIPAMDLSKFRFTEPHDLDAMPAILDWGAYYLLDRRTGEKSETDEGPDGQTATWRQMPLEATLATHPPSTVE